ncbi:hypothetical protein [Geminocystis sp. NIES-3709]|uniref:hypothetical protein n=1 Tax=Geminocystis sp. NIES-3709 TaxID=1617448 RepID=UPI0005FCBF79|nr:hypothetical protein [Geminocystis sp. NIES-3709]BAQ65549.1 hypothetical protein GM3709_2314 [Geminocystis sp. NIES-3709]
MKTLKKKQFSLKLTQEEYEILKIIAEKKGYLYGGKGNVSKVCSAIARKELVLVEKKDIDKLVSSLLY